MEITIKGYFFDGDLKEFSARVNEETAPYARGRLEFERTKIIDYLKDLYTKGEIASVFRPKNKQMQKHLNELVKAKKELKDSIEKIKLIL